MRRAGSRTAAPTVNLPIPPAARGPPTHACAYDRRQADARPRIRYRRGRGFLLRLSRTCPW
ncbi:hypothetical protein C6Q28_14795 [Burkholderia multivorans]|nr:hypothetical protein C6Q28_14795 [Burkholderia multivorans]